MLCFRFFKRYLILYISDQATLWLVSREETLTFGSANARARQAKRDRKSDMVTHITSKYIRLTVTMPTWYNSKYKKTSISPSLMLVVWSTL